MTRQNLNYEELYDRLLERGLILHRNNKKRIKAGLIFLAVFTVAMIFIRWLTNSDRVVFMVIWVIGMFVISIYLVSVEYIDNSVQKTLEDVTEREMEFGGLLPDPESVRGIIQEKMQEGYEGMQAHYNELRRRSADSGTVTDSSEESAESEDEA